MDACWLKALSLLHGPTLEPVYILLNFWPTWAGKGKSDKNDMETSDTIFEGSNWSHGQDRNMILDTIQAIKMTSWPIHPTCIDILVPVFIYPCCMTFCTSWPMCKTAVCPQIFWGKKRHIFKLVKFQTGFKLLRLTSPSGLQYFETISHTAHDIKLSWTTTSLGWLPW